MNYKNLIAAGLIAASIETEGCTDTKKTEQIEPKVAPSASSQNDAEALKALAELRETFRKADVHLNLQAAPAFSLCDQMYNKVNVPDYVGGTSSSSRTSFKDGKQISSLPEYRVRISRSIQYVLDGKKISATCSHEKKLSDDNGGVKELPQYIAKYGKGFSYREGDYRELRMTQQIDGSEFIYTDDKPQNSDTGEVEDILTSHIDGIVNDFLIVDRKKDKVTDSFSIGNTFFPPKNEDDKKINNERAARTIATQEKFKILVDGGIEKLEKKEYVPMKIVNHKLQAF